MKRWASAAWAVTVLAAGAGAGVARIHADWQVKPSEGRAELMRHHFDAVTAIRDAVIRGDLSSVREQGLMVASMPDPVGLPPAGLAPLKTLKTTAARAARATDLRGAAIDAASMLAICGDCHRAVGTMPAYPAPPQPIVGGVIGHMEQHRAAADLLSQGLTTPSTSLWHDGAEALEAAPLREEQLPHNANITHTQLKTEKAIHNLAARARTAADRDARVAIYGELISGCSSCHAGNRNGYTPAPGGE
jgi:mono/diheme cytochrome c family protein